MDTITFVRSQIETAHQYMDRALEELTPEVAHWQPPGTANPIANLLAHPVIGEDFFINGALQGKPIVFASGGWGEKTGIPEERSRIWEKDWRLNLDAFREYNAAVQASVAAFLNSLKADDLDREVETRFFGKQPAAWLLQNIVIAHILGHMGEVSALKGVQGLKGLPF